MQRFVQFKLGSHQLPIVLGRFAEGQHVARANRVCTHCVSVAVADALNMISECPALQAVRQQYAPLVSTNTNTMRHVLHSRTICKFSSSFYNVFMSARFEHHSSSTCHQTCRLAKALQSLSVSLTLLNSFPLSLTQSKVLTIVTNENSPLHLLAFEQ